MQRLAHWGAFWALVIIFASSSLAQTGDGYIGIYSDALGTIPCVSVPPQTATTLYVIAKTSGMTASGISGAEFRIEVENPAGWSITYTPPAADIVIGNALDLYPQDPADGSGINLAFDPCEVPVAGKVPLGTISVGNISGAGTRLLVKRHSSPTNPTRQCPLFTLCDGPVFSLSCMTPSTEPPCSLSVLNLELSKATDLQTASDAPVFAMHLNVENVGGPPPSEGEDPGDPSREVLAMFSKGIIQLPPGQTSAPMTNATINSSQVLTHLQNHNVERISLAHPDHAEYGPFGRVRNGGTVRLADLSEIYRITLPVGGDRQQLADQLSTVIGVLFAEPHGEFVEPTATVPNDPDFASKQWPLRNTGQTGGSPDADIDADLAWDITVGHRSKRIAIADFGMDVNNTEFAGKLVEGGSTAPPNATFPSHASHVAGIAAANTNNSFGMAGVDWKAELANVRVDVVGDNNVAYEIALASFLLQPDVFNHSWRLSTGEPDFHPRDSSIIRLAFRDAYMMNQVAVVSMGNQEGPNPIDAVYYPAGFPQGVIAVGATDSEDDYVGFSHTGPHIDVAAPGLFVWSADAGNAFSFDSGTSLAAPHVSGLATLLLSVAPHLANDDVEQLIRLGTDDITEFPAGPGFDDFTGAGRINAHETLQLLNLPNRLLQLSEGGGTTVAAIGPEIVNFVAPPSDDPFYPPGTYLGHFLEVRRAVTFPVTFASPPQVWGRGASTVGFRLETTEDFGEHYAYGYCEPVPGTITQSGCVLRTYVFRCTEIWCTNEPGSGDGLHLPTRPEWVLFEYTAFGQLTPTDVELARRETTPSIRFTVTSPIRDSSVLQLTLPREAHVDLSIWNVAGQRVADVYNATLDPGSHTLRWAGRISSGQRAASGLYFARLVAGDVTLTRKLVMLR